MGARTTKRLLFILAAFFTLAQADSQAEGLRHKYYLLAETGYKPMCLVDVHINNEHVLGVGPNVKKEVVEVTPYLKNGQNTISFEAHALSGEGDDYSATSIQIGEGEFAEDKLSWEAVKVAYSINRAAIKKEKKEILVQVFTLAAE